MFLLLSKGNKLLSNPPPPINRDHEHHLLVTFSISCRHQSHPLPKKHPKSNAIDFFYLIHPKKTAPHPNTSTATLSKQKMWFCPLDGTLLQISTSTFLCPTCPYSLPITNSQITKSYPPRKKVDDILGGEKAWENVDRTMAVCPSCSAGEAYFMMMQIRSADEPMSVFYKCVECSFQWNDK